MRDSLISNNVSMNKQTAIGIVGVIVLVLIALWYMSAYPNGMSGQNATTTTPSTQNNTTNTNTTGVTTASTKTAFRSLFTQDGSHQCTYTQVGSGQSNSVIYIADGKMRGEFRTTPGANEAGSANLMIYSGGTLYVWQEGATTGKKSTITSLTELPQVIPADLAGGAIFGAAADNVGWDCHAWSKDTKMFAVPTYVTFTTKAS
jgi:hypothetical protein